MMDNTNEMQIIFDSRPVNEGLARVTEIGRAHV